MRRVGLTGGIGSGKSAVSALLAGRGAVVIDADLLAREVVAPGTPGLAAIVEAFGPGVLTTTGQLDRTAMGQLVFDDAEARAKLEAIIHPLVRARATQIEAMAPTESVIVHDIPLLVETGQAGDFDTVVVVDAPAEQQVERLTSRRGMSTEEARARIAAQATRAQRLAVADHVVVNDGLLDDLESKVERIWAALRAPTAEGSDSHAAGPRQNRILRDEN